MTTAELEAQGGFLVHPDFLADLKRAILKHYWRGAYRASRLYRQSRVGGTLAWRKVKGSHVERGPTAEWLIGDEVKRINGMLGAT